MDDSYSQDTSLCYGYFIERNLYVGERLVLNSLARRIIAGFACILGFVLIGVLFTIFQLRGISETSNQVFNQYFQALTHNMVILNGVNGSLANLRGWMIIGDEKICFARPAIDATFETAANQYKNKLSPFC